MQRSSDRIGARRGPVEPKSDMENLWFRRLIAVIASGFLIAWFIFSVHFYSSTRLRMEQDPLVTNLTKEGFSAKIKIGVSPSCDGDVECWVGPELNETDWVDTPMPMRPDHDIRSIPGYAAHRSGD